MVIADNMGGEYVILNLETGNYFSALNTGATAWEMLSNGYTAKETAEAFATHFSVSLQQVEKDIAVLLKAFLEQNLIKNYEGTTPKAEVRLEENKAYSPPQMTS